MAKTKKAAKKKRRATVADVPKRKVKPDSLSEQLKKSFALTDCKRVVALFEAWADAKLHKAACQEKQKSIHEKYEKAEGVAEQKTAALHLVRNKEEIDAASNSLKATVHDLMELIGELADGSTVFAAAVSPAEEAEPDDPSQEKLGFASHPKAMAADKGGEDGGD